MTITERTMKLLDVSLYMIWKQCPTISLTYSSFCVCVHLGNGAIDEYAEF